MLSSEGIDFDVVDLSKDDTAMSLVKGMGYTSAPVVVAGDTHWSGFRYERLQGLIKKMKSDDVHKSA